MIGVPSQLTSTSVRHFRLLLRPFPRSYSTQVCVSQRTPAAPLLPGLRGPVLAVLAVSSLLARSIIHSSCKLYVFIIDFNVRTICERSFSHCGSRGWMSFIPVTRSLLPHDLRLLSCNKSHLYIDLIIFRVRAGPHPKRWTIWVL